MVYGLWTPPLGSCRDGGGKKRRKDGEGRGLSAAFLFISLSSLLFWV